MIRHLNLLLYHEMALRDQICFVRLQTEPVFCLFILSVFSGGINLATFVIICVVSYLDVYKAQKTNRTITHCFLSLYCTIWAPFLIFILLKMHMCCICCYVLYLYCFKLWELSPNSPSPLPLTPVWLFTPHLQSTFLKGMSGLLMCTSQDMFL